MKNMKLKRILGISSIMLVGLGISIPIALTTSCSGSVDSVDLTFTSKADFDKYFQDHHDVYNDSLDAYSASSMEIFDYFITNHRISAANMLYSGMSEMAIPSLSKDATNDNPLKLKINVGDSDARLEITKDFYIDLDEGAKATYKAGSFVEYSINDEAIVRHSKFIYWLTYKNYSYEINNEINSSIPGNFDNNHTNVDIYSISDMFYLRLAHFVSNEIEFVLPTAWYPNVVFNV